MKTLKYLLILSLVCITSSCYNNQNSLTSYGNRQMIINQNNLNGTVRLDTLLSKKHNYAIGPVEGLQGEVTVYDDEVSISTVKNGRPKVNDSKHTKAIFLLKANQANWQKMEITENLNGLDAIEGYVQNALSKNGMDTEKAYPFRIETTPKFLEYHIIFKMDDAPHNMKEHKKAKQKFILENEEIKIIGFWVNTERMGKLTHPGKRTHLHFIKADGGTSGHIDDISISRGAILFLPK
ncbi:acetolactate decarboxylase [Ulvibacterium sp.]|uniref:acetolactate decarboxylase n=1 Tax=Ulvibacterium sp. TaxID=2665914 RepID=UPI0026254328|nr:acetolactate decarboxylase [Ulvibacterium sp.]